jgi:multidrug efflux pump subunit AcrA (membrane-fusion protein)
MTVLETQRRQTQAAIDRQKAMLAQAQLDLSYTKFHAVEAGTVDNKAEALLNQLPADEAVMFADAVHPTHAARAVGCWAPKDVPVAITQSSLRERLNIHGAIDLETGNTRRRMQPAISSKLCSGFQSS